MEDTDKSIGQIFQAVEAVQLRMGEISAQNVGLLNKMNGFAVTASPPEVVQSETPDPETAPEVSPAPPAPSTNGDGYSRQGDAISKFPLLTQETPDLPVDLLDRVIGYGLSLLPQNAPADQINDAIRAIQRHMVGYQRTSLQEGSPEVPGPGRLLEGFAEPQLGRADPRATGAPEDHRRDTQGVRGGCLG